MRNFALILVALWSLESLAYPVTSCERAANPEAALARMHGYDRTWIWANKLFPRAVEMIRLSLTALFLAEELEVSDLRDYQANSASRIYEAGLKFHRHLGITPPPSAYNLEQVENLVDAVNHDVPILALRALGVVVDPEPLPQVLNKMASTFADFYTGSKWKSDVRRSQAYGRTILETMRSKEMVKISRRFTDGYSRSDKRRLSPEQHIDAATAHHLAIDLLVARLEEKFPELRAPYNPAYPHWGSYAKALIQTMNQLH